MIEPSTTEFPNNVIAVLAARIPGFVDPTGTGSEQDVTVLLRPLRPADPMQCVGVFPSTKIGDPTTAETGSREPTLKRYTVVLQSMVHDTEEEKCISVHSILAQRLWRMLYADTVLEAGLTSLSVVANNTIERFQRCGVAQQRYLSNEVTGVFIQTSWIEFWFDTETVRT